MYNNHSLNGEFQEELKKYLDSFKVNMGKNNENKNKAKHDVIKEWLNNGCKQDHKKDKHNDSCKKDSKKIEVKWDFSDWCHEYPINPVNNTKKTIWTAFAAGLAFNRSFCLCRNVNQNGIANSSNIGPGKKKQPH